MYPQESSLAIGIGIAIAEIEFLQRVVEAEQGWVWRHLEINFEKVDQVGIFTQTG